MHMNKKILVLLIGIFLILVVTAEIKTKEYILLEFSYNNGNFNLVNKSLEQGNYPSLSHDIGAEYNINLISEDNLILYSNNFNPVLLYSDGFDKEMEGEAVELDTTEFFMILPSIKEAEKIEILKGNKKVFEEEIYDVGATSCRIK